MGFTHRIRVRYGEVDAQGVVFNAHWMTYLDDALTHYFKYLGYEPKVMFFEQEGFDVVLAHAHIDWHGPARFDDLIELSAEPRRLGQASFDLGYTAIVDGEIRLQATVTYVSIDPTTNASRPIPAEIRSKLGRDTR